MPQPISIRELEKFKKKASTLEKEVSNLNARIKTLSDTRKDLRNRLAIAGREKINLAEKHKKEKDILSKELAQKNAANEMLKVDVNRIPVLEDKILDLQNIVKNLNNSIKNKDVYIKTLGDEKVKLSNEIAGLKNQLVEKDNEIKTNKVDKKAAITAYEQKIKNYETRISEKDSEIKIWEKKIKEFQVETELDSKLIQEYETTRIKYETIKKDHDLKDQELANIRADLSTLRFSFNNVKKEKEDYQKLYLKEQQLKNKYMQDFSNLNQKIQTSYTSEQIANYFKESIDNFNKQITTSNRAVNYIIGEMDVELKSHLGKTESNEMILSSPDFSVKSEKALSSIKFTIRAVPRMTAEEK